MYSVVRDLHIHGVPLPMVNTSGDDSTGKYKSKI